MTWNPNRLPCYVWSNCGNSAPDDPWDRDIEYTRDPAGELQRQFGIAEPAANFCLAWSGGYLRNAPSGPAMLFQEAEARDACLDLTSARRAKGKQTWLYIGRIMPTGGTFDVGDGATLGWMAENLAPYLEAGVSRVIVDELSMNLTTRASCRKAARHFRAFGKDFAGNAIPADLTGLPAGRVPPDRLSKLDLLTCAWVTIPEEVDGADPDREYRFDPRVTEVRFWFEDQHWWGRPVELAVAEIRARRTQGYVVDCVNATRPEVLAEILAAPVAATAGEVTT